MVGFETFPLDSVRFALTYIVQPFWPFVLFPILVILFRSTWLFWRQSLFKADMKWVLLELRIPREIKKSPRAMEQTLAAIHQYRNVASNLREVYWDGEVTRWYSLELVSFGGEIHLYVRCYRKQKNLVQSAFFAYYPDMEIVEVPDYVDRLPADVPELYAQGYDLWGTEMALAREDAYPIKTYTAFEAPAEEKEFDPMAAFLEILGKIDKREIVAIQILIAPAASNWRDTWKGFVEKLRETKIKEAKMTTTEGQVESFARFLMRSPGETDVLKAVESNLAKQAFETIIRFVYLSPRQIFWDSFARRGLLATFNQYAALDLNYFKRNDKVSTRTEVWYPPHLYPKRRVEYRKQRVLHDYRNRELAPTLFMHKLLTSYFFNPNFGHKSFSMTTEGLATIFHPPTYLVLTAPHVPRVESRKGSPPAGLAIFGDESAIEQFK